MRKTLLLGGAILVTAGAHIGACAQSIDTPDPVSAVTVYGREIDLIGVGQAASEGVVGYKDFENRPLSRVGELVENVPGVIATQHSGTGKANQYFLRGFNLDHGTDFAGFVDGAPVNMRTHGHGQGYLDFNFLIPELVERIDYRKGPYFADVGDFSAAGTVKFTTADRLAQPMVEGQAGSFGYYRGLVAGSGQVGGGDLLVGVEGVVSDGPWVLDEDLRKVNALAKYSSGTDAEGWKLALSLYSADWNSTDQIPQRAVDSGRISRLGFIDPDLGGATRRAALTGEWSGGGLHANAYAIAYRLRLTSNFTYGLDDPVNGDEFQQRDQRSVFGGALNKSFDTQVAGRAVTFNLGGDARYDAIGKGGLYRTVAGDIAATVRQDKVGEYSGALFGEAKLSLTPSVRAIFGLRGDVYGWNVDADLAANSGDGSQALISPKFALAWQVSHGLEAYANYGEGFHSNDVRGATITLDPATGDPAERVDVLARARGAEVGAKFSRSRFNASLVAYALTLDSELVFVGDAGSTEPNDATERYGVEATVFWRPTDWLTLDASAAATQARFRDVDAGQNRIPGSVGEVVAAGAVLDFGRGFTATARVRHFGSAPLIEDNSQRSEPTTLVNLGAYYSWGPARLGVDLLNLFDSRDSDITYFYASQLSGEAAPVEDFHFHPVEPFQVRASLRYAF